MTATFAAAYSIKKRFPVFQTVAFPTHLDRVAVKGQTVQHSGGQCRIIQKLGPLLEPFVGRNQHRRLLLYAGFGEAGYSDQ